ncbi:MAG: LLM class F420-dependent oxidoreductase [Actinomycetes bacterium]
MLLRIFTEPQQGATHDQLLAVARRTEALGFDAFFRSDHYLLMGDRDPGPGGSDAWITLAALARETSRIRLGTLVSPVTFRHPGVLAVTVAQVDAMSGGRVELGLGTGWYDAEHTAYGIPFPPTRERFDDLEEQLAIVTGLWSTPIGERFSYSGTRHTVIDSPALPKPVQRPHPPVIVGGYGTKRTPALAARHAAEFNLPFADLDTFTTASARVDAACQSIDRDPGTLVRSVALCVACGEDAAEVDRRATAAGHDPAGLRAYGLAGTPDALVERIEAYRAAGAQRVYLQVLDLDDLDHLDLIAARVLPEVSP